jgi:HSP20 family molecular chaperone IbpA
MFWRRFTLIGVLMLVIGIALGYGLSTWTHHHNRDRARIAAKHYRPADHNNKAGTPTIAANNKNNQTQKWDPFAEMDRMQKDIDGAIQRATQQLRLGSTSMPDWDSGAGFSSALDVRDRGDHYEVRADLPNTDQKDVKVTTEGDREIHVDVTQHQEQKKDANGTQSTFSEFGSYDQLVTLPGPADMKEMKVDNHNGELIITIPKAKAS